MPAAEERRTPDSVGAWPGAAEQRSARPRRSPHAGAAALKHRGRRRREPWPHGSRGRSQAQESPGDPAPACGGEPSAEDTTAGSGRAGVNEDAQHGGGHPVPANTGFLENTNEKEQTTRGVN